MSELRYQFENISQDEREYWEAILLEEIEIQSWFAVYCIRGEEGFVTVK